MAISLQQKHLLLFNQQRIGAILRSLVLAKGGVLFPMQETSGLVALATNPALALGRDIVIEGAFPNNPGVWTLGASWTIAGGKALYDDVGNDPVKQPLPIQGGANYTINFDIADLAAGTARLIVANESGSVFFVPIDNYPNGSYSIDFTAPSTETGLGIFGNNASAGTWSITNIVLKQTDIAASSSFPGAEEYITANAASDPAGNEADATTGWAVVFGATLTSDSAVKSTGNFSIKAVFSGAAEAIQFDLDSILTSGKRYQLSFTTRHLGSGGIVQSFLASSPNGTNNLLIEQSNTDTTFQSVIVEFTHSATTRYFNTRERSGTDDGGVYIDDVSFTLANPLNGYNTGAEVGVDAGRFLDRAYSFDGLVTFLDIYSAEFNSVFNPNQGTLLLYVKKPDWAGTRYHVNLEADINNRINILQFGGDLLIRRIAGAVASNSVVITSTTGYFLPVITWDTEEDEVITYVNGVVQDVHTGIGDWVGNLDPTLVVIGASSTVPTSVTNGDITQTLLLPEVLTAAEIARIARAGGV